jgi:hypothetical protein
MWHWGILSLGFEVRAMRLASYILTLTLYYNTFGNRKPTNVESEAQNTKIADRSDIALVEDGYASGNLIPS